MDKDVSTDYELKDKTNGVYVFVIDGDVTVNGQQLNRRDAVGITEAERLEITAKSESEVLLMEVPMH
jgi:redox-sensitive bicupin YhaK (pirin superfamily)